MRNTKYKSRKNRKRALIRQRLFIKSYAGYTGTIERKSVLSRISAALNKFKAPQLVIPKAINRADMRTRQSVASHQAGRKS